MKGTTEFSKGDILKLAYPLAGDPKLFSDLFEGLGFVAIESETGINDFALAIVEDIEQVANLIAEILVAKLLERRLSLLITNNVSKRCVVLIA